MWPPARDRPAPALRRRCRGTYGKSGSATRPHECGPGGLPQNDIFPEETGKQASCCRSDCNHHSAVDQLLFRSPTLSHSERYPHWRRRRRPEMRILHELLVAGDTAARTCCCSCNTIMYSTFSFCTSAKDSTKHFSGPDRALGPVYTCLCVSTSFELNDI